ncbi:hypothetical protein ACQYAD_03610 [Neobacillus sp. SM06]|uniref:hypothetical protein n=1 Tax=Neobacillus sp. SM06 TaxID=3422492 RepID=UPI003D2AFEFD
MLLVIPVPTVMTFGNKVNAETAADPAPTITHKGTTLKGKILFDNTHGETAGAADWVIDGAFSDFANAIAGQGYEVKELRQTTPITLDSLKNYDVFVLGEANIPFKASEQQAMLDYVKGGGSIFFIGDHYNSDRNLNRWDSGEIFNGYRRGAWDNPAKGMSTEEANSQAMQGVISSDWLGENFGVRFRSNALGDIPSGETVVAPEQSFGITQGVTTVEMHAGSTLAILDPTKAKGLIYLPENPPKWGPAVDQGVYNNGGIAEGAFAAIAKVDKGKAAFLGDSSPVEDSTPKYLREDNGKAKTTYDGFSTEGQDRVYLINTINWLAKQEDYTSLDQINGLQLSEKTVLHDFEIPQHTTEPQPEPWAAPSGGYKWYDPTTFAAGSYGSNKTVQAQPIYTFQHQATLPNQQEFQIRLNGSDLAAGQTVSNLQVGIYAPGGKQLATFQNSSGWATTAGYSEKFAITADATGQAHQDLTLKLDPSYSGSANLRLKINGSTRTTVAVTIGNVPAEPLPGYETPVPAAVSIDKARQAADGTNVTEEGVITTTPGSWGGGGFYLQDDSGGISFEFDAVNGTTTTRVRVDSRTGVTYDQFTSQYKENNVLNITGIASIFKGIYQLKPRMAADFADTPQQKDPVNVQLLGINDLHGKMDPHYSVDIDGDGKTDGTYGGAEYLATYIRQKQAAKPGRTLFVGAGDFTIKAKRLMGTQLKHAATHSRIPQQRYLITYLLGF